MSEHAVLSPDELDAIRCRFYAEGDDGAMFIDSDAAALFRHITAITAERDRLLADNKVLNQAVDFANSTIHVMCEQLEQINGRLAILCADEVST